MSDNKKIIYNFITPQKSYTRIIYDYQDLNKDPKVHDQIINFFQKKIIKWMNNNLIKKNINFIKSKEGYFGKSIVNEDDLLLFIWNWEFANFQVLF